MVLSTAEQKAYPSMKKTPSLNPLVDKYLVDGCMRCHHGGTPRCKVRSWTEALETLRQVVLQTGLEEEIKWGVPVYTFSGKNVVTVNALKDSANLGFFKGSLLSDPHRILEQQGRLQSARLIRFRHVGDILNMADILKSYVSEAIAIEVSGKKLITVKNPEPIPGELHQAFAQDPTLRRAFHELTPGRQRGYIVYFSQPKQTVTRMARIAKCKALIMDGVGLHDKYRCRSNYIAPGDK